MNSPVKFRQISQLVTMNPRGKGQAASFAMIANAALVVEDGRVVWAGPEDEVPSPFQNAESIDCGGRLVTPGLVDAHTHLLYAGHRAHEVSLRAQGKNYLEILAAGGGILTTVQQTRQASDQALRDGLRKRLQTALTHGTTAIEVKTGYDLTVAGELRLLRILKEVQASSPMRIVTTCLAAHAVPEEYRGRGQAYLEHLTDALLPQVGNLAEFVDIFCEPGVFNRDESRAYLETAKKLGLSIKLHVDELTDGEGARLAAELHAASADHCAMTGLNGIEAMARAGVTAVILPGTAGYLHHGGMADARTMIDRGVGVAIGSDGNPGSSPTEALSMIMPWAAAWLHLVPEEVWVGMTVMGARALRLADRGALVPGMMADFLIWDTDDYRYPCYHYGSNLVQAVYLGGVPVL